MRSFEIAFPCAMSLVRFDFSFVTTPLTNHTLCKRFLGEHRMETETNLAAGRRAIAAGTHYIRVHDVAAHHEPIRRN